MQRLTTRYGTLSVPDPESDMIGRFLATYGEWAFNEVRFCASLLRPGARVLDIGAFVGTFGLGLAELVPLDALCCVEANPAVIPHLEQNLRLVRGPVAVSMVNALVAPPGHHACGTVQEDHNLGSMSFAGAVPGPADNRSGAVMVEAPAIVRLADLRGTHGPFDLVKLDAEGMEHVILSDDRDHLATGETLVWIECNESVRSLDCADLLLEMGLALFFFAFPAHSHDNFAGEATSLLPWAYEAGLLASARDVVPALDPVLQDNRCILRPIPHREALRLALWQTPRWAPAGWPEDASAQTLVALAGHEITSRDYARFLIGPETEQFDRSRSASELRLGATEAALTEASALAISRLHALERLEVGLANASTLALDRLQALTMAERRIADLDAALEEARTLLYETQAKEAALRAQLTSTEQGLAEATRLALDRLEELGRRAP